MILFFPCNQFGGQEPGSAEQIKAFVRKYGTDDFLIFEKGDVNGSNVRPVFEHLKEHCPGSFLGTSVKWNFTKFLVDATGKSVKRFGPTSSPLTMEKDIVKLLNERKGPDGKALDTVVQKRSFDDVVVHAQKAASESNLRAGGVKIEG